MWSPNKLNFLSTYWYDSIWELLLQNQHKLLRFFADFVYVIWLPKDKLWATDEELQSSSVKISTLSK